MQGPNSGMLQIVPLIFIFGIFYFLIIRPQQKKQKDHLAMIQNIKKNDEVVTVGGVHGTVINVKEKTFIVRIDENVKVEIDKSSVAYIKKVRQ
ncbi:MAG: preprotein translocase subunit YajC [Candidatus Omnitrophica bacterium]|nr:preprotein translocase subunit YajC [Candidatus Omnitrophota bacterium]MDD5430041.1 preprotein translocase subunit YajC [Candidatus Omnitrophota bacterium]